MSKRRETELISATQAASSSVGRNVIAVIGINHYHHWRRLSNAVHDATGTLELFQRLGFEQAVEPLLDERATGKAIQSLVTDKLRMLDSDDSLVLFYAGHGATQKHHLGSRVIKTGYLIPIDASDSPDEVSTWIGLEGWLRAVSLLPPKHILVILDACHSGIALDPIIKWRDVDSWKDAPLSTLKARYSRRIITSALDDQVALDSGPVHEHSLFTGCLIEGLTCGIRRDGSRVTTGSELGQYLQRRVATYPGSWQTPDFGTFSLDDRGEMVIPLETGAPEPGVASHAASSTFLAVSGARMAPRRGGRRWPIAAAMTVLIGGIVVVVVASRDGSRPLAPPASPPSSLVVPAVVPVATTPIPPPSSVAFAPSSVTPPAADAVVTTPAAPPAPSTAQPGISSAARINVRTSSETAPGAEAVVTSPSARAKQSRTSPKASASPAKASAVDAKVSMEPAKSPASPAKVTASDAKKPVSDAKPVVSGAEPAVSPASSVNQFAKQAPPADPTPPADDDPLAKRK